MIFAAADNPHPLPLPYYAAPRPSAGFPSPAAEYIEGQIDLNTHLISQPAATFFVRVAGDSLEKAGIYDGDLAVVDRSMRPRPGHVVVVILYGELLMKRLRHVGSTVWLDPDSEDPRYQSIEVPADANFEIWGVVKNTIRDHLF